MVGGEDEQDWCKRQLVKIAGEGGPHKRVGESGW